MFSTKNPKINYQLNYNDKKEKKMNKKLCIIACLTCDFMQHSHMLIISEIEIFLQFKELKGNSLISGSNVFNVHLPSFSFCVSSSASPARCDISNGFCSGVNVLSEIDSFITIVGHFLENIVFIG